jgi:hypothetical protein
MDVDYEHSTANINLNVEVDKLRLLIQPDPLDKRRIARRISEPYCS